MSQTAKQLLLPIYEKPPVVETVLGLQFNPLSAFTNAHLGAFWQSLGVEAWPTVTDKPPLPRQEERFTPDAQWGNVLRLQLTQDPTARIQIQNREGNRMIQLQNGRIHLNWLGSDGDKYPNYTQIRSELETYWTHLESFAAKHRLGKIVPDQWEVTYVNQIPKDGIWSSPADWSFFKPLNAVVSIDGLIDAESFSGEWHFIIPDRRGRLHVNWQHAKTGDENENEVIRLSLTARGPISENETNSSILECIDLGHDTIVCAFRNLMNDSANQEWGLKNATTDR